MNSWKTILTLVLAVLCAGGTAAWAADCIFQQTDITSGEYRWETDTNWSCGHEPTAADRAIIPTGLTSYVSQSDSVADRVRVEGTGILNIKASSKLTLDHSNDAFSYVLDSGSVIRLLGSSAELAFIDNDATVSGAGIIDGESDSATIFMEQGITLTNEVNITGNLVIDAMDGTGASFANEGVVEANNASGTLAIKVEGTLSDFASADRWKVSTSLAVLQFHSDIADATGLVGDFNVSNGTLDIDEALTSTGKMTLSGGTVSVDQTTLMGGATKLLSMTGGSVVVAISQTFTHN